MKLGIDLRCLPSDGNPGGGIAHAARAIAYELNARTDAILYLPTGAFIEPCHAETILLPNGTRRSILRAIREYPCDALFVPSGAPPLGIRVPAYPWTHDLDIFFHPEWFPQSRLQRLLTTSMVKYGLRRAPAVLAVSEYAKRQVMHVAHRSSDDIHVTGEGGDTLLASFDTSSLQNHRQKCRRLLDAKGISRPYILVLGTVEPRKNISFIASLWPELSQRFSGIDLVLAGKDGWKTDDIYRDIEHARSSSASDILRIKSVSDEERRALLLNASLVLVPSLSEGFGLVALEAAQAGTPVLISGRGALAEVLGDGAWNLGVKNAKVWLDMVGRMLSDTRYRQNILAAQSECAKRWSWRRAADVILTTIRSHA